MRKIKAVFSIGAAALILSGTASAQIPQLGISFGELDETDSGSICAVTGTSCSTIAEGAGFIQRQIDKGGKSYIQTIISESGFESEDFVQINFGGNGSVQGIASKLSLTEGAYTADTSTSGFEATSTITAGWAASGGAGVQSNAIIEVNISDNGGGTTGIADPANGFASAFTVDTDFNGTSNTIKSLTASQTAKLGSAGDKQVFFTEIKAAGTAGSDTIGGAGKGTVDWAIGDQIQVVWVGQNMPDAGIGGFGAQSISNLDSTGANSITSYSSLTDPSPQAWNAEFGTSPTF